MSTIYETRGRAREYCELALNLYRGCGHHCTYCWAPAATRQTAAAFASPTSRNGIIEQLGRDAPKWRGESRPVLLSFTSDPYQLLDVEMCLTRQAIECLHFYGLRVGILSKGGCRAMRDLDLLGEDDWFGATLTTLDDVQAAEWEPGAAPPSERVEALAAAHAKGIPTWASLEPVIDAEASLDVIRQTHEIIDEYKVGVLNYVKSSIDWRRFGRDPVSLLESLGCAYYLKHDLRTRMA